MAKKPESENNGEASRRRKPAPANVSATDLATLITSLSRAGGVPITLSALPSPVVNTADRLRRKPRVTVAFPPCADELLALIKTADTDDITQSFKDYFKFARHHILGEGAVINDDLDDQLGEVLDPALLSCSGDIILLRSKGGAERSGYYGSAWPTECCLCSPCVTLDGARNNEPASTVATGIRRLFIGDALWLFYFERMGINQILGAILDAFAYNGRLPISNGSLEVGVKDDIVALILEVMVRQTKMGLAPGVRDRASLYRTALGWNSKPGQALNLDTEVNLGFNTLFHRFIYNALEFYKDRRLAVAIRGTTSPEAPPSAATLITVSNTIEVLKKRFEAFDYGRNYYNTLAGIVWTIAAMTVVKELRTTLGIPPAFNEAHEFIPAAYDLLVMKRPVTSGDINPYLEHRRCAEEGRDILLDLEVVDFTKNRPGQELDNWLSQIEAKVEAYRTAYRNLTGIDLGVTAAPATEQVA